VDEDINMVEALGLMDSLGVRLVRARTSNPFQTTLGEVLSLGTYHNRKELLICELEQVPIRATHSQVPS
jgi:hypothetical protein